LITIARKREVIDISEDDGNDLPRDPVNINEQQVEPIMEIGYDEGKSHYTEIKSNHHFY
jgi:hypothetical protein